MIRHNTYTIWLWLTTVCLLLSACAGDVQPDETVGNKHSAGNDSVAYVNLRIVSGQGTRATEAEESAIYDGILAIFEGTEAATATLRTATYIDQLINNPGTSSNITVIQRLAVGTHPYSNKCYVLVLLNTTSTGYAVDGTALKFNGVAIPDADSNGSITLSDVQSLTLNSVGSPDEHVGLFMTNSSGLVEATALFDTEAEARDVGAASVTVNVERAAAKVKVINGINTTLSNIKLDDINDSYPTVHRMSWALASEASGNFSLYQQKSHQSGDAIYIAENTSTATNIIVELQLKKGSFLMDDCYAFFPLDNGGFRENTFHDLYTSASQFAAYLKSGWPYQKGAYNLGDRSADDIFENMKLELADNGAVTVTFTMDKTDYSPTELTGLSNLKTFLEGHTHGFKNGKMYYTFSIPSIVRNNAYNLTLLNSSITAIGRPTP